MKVNCSKTKILLFNAAKKTDFEPLVPIPNGDDIEYVTETKILGMILTEDLKTFKNTKYMVDKAYKRM